MGWAGLRRQPPQLSLLSVPGALARSQLIHCYFHLPWPVRQAEDRLPGVWLAPGCYIYTYGTAARSQRFSKSAIAWHQCQACNSTRCLATERKPGRFNVRVWGSREMTMHEVAPGPLPGWQPAWHNKSTTRPRRLRCFAGVVRIPSLHQLTRPIQLACELARASIVDCPGTPRATGPLRASGNAAHVDDVGRTCLGEELCLGC